MKRKLIIFAGMVVTLLGLYFAFFHRTQEASMLLINGIVYTANDKQPAAQAVAIRDSKIVGVGSNEHIQSKFTSSRIIDLKGRSVYPGFVDAHGHMEGLGAFASNINLVDTRSIEEIQKLVAQRVTGLKPGTWVRGRGWDQNKWELKRKPVN